MKVDSSRAEPRELSPWAVESEGVAAGGRHCSTHCSHDGYTPLVAIPRDLEAPVSARGFKVPMARLRLEHEPGHDSVSFRPAIGWERGWWF